MSERVFGSHVINVTHPDKVLFPADGIRKQDVIDYYRWIPSTGEALRDLKM